MAEILGIPEATVRTRLFYARKELVTLLRGHKGFVDVKGLAPLPVPVPAPVPAPVPGPGPNGGAP